MSDRTFRRFGGGALAVKTADDGARSADCFADEVAIDFPSIAHAVDRIRHGFLHDERPTPFEAALALSRREALGGATVPLDVPVRCICRACGGRGESWAEPCAQCHGSGGEYLRHQLQVDVPAGVFDGARFRFTVAPRHHPATLIELRISVV